MLKKGDKVIYIKHVKMKGDTIPWSTLTIGKIYTITYSGLGYLLIKECKKNYLYSPRAFKFFIKRKLVLNLP